jgi:hypothetical protein
MLTTRRKFIVFVIAVSAAHLMLTFFSIAIPFVLGSPRFDNPELPVSLLERIASSASHALVQPLMLILDLLHLNPRGTLVEWSSFLANSLVWGLGFAFCIRRLTSRSTRTPPAQAGFLFLALAIPASLIASAQAGPVSFFR